MTDREHWDWDTIVVLPVLILVMCTGLPIIGPMLFWCGLGGAWFLVWRDFQPLKPLRRCDIRPETMVRVMGLNLISWIGASVIWVLILAI